MPGVGSATIDFGAQPGKNIATVDVTGQGAISTTSHAEAWFMADSTAEHNAYEHTMAPLLVALVCSVPTAGIGFTITASSQYNLTGTLKIHWVWSD